MIRGFAILFGCQLLGELLTRTTGWPVPGNVLGMTLLLVALMLDVVRLEWVTEAAELLLTNMALLFIPVGVAVMQYFDLLAREWLPIVTATVLSTFVVIAVTALVADRLADPSQAGGGDDS